MKATFNRTGLAKALGVAAKVSPTRSPKLILQNVLITADGTVKATDLEVVSVSLTTPCEGREGDSVCLPAQQLRQAVGLMTSEDVEIHSSANEVTATGGRVEYDLPFEDVDNFPTSCFTTPDDDPTFTIAATELVKAIRLTEHAAADESARYALTGVNFDLLEGKPILVATDGKRMATQPLPVTCSGESRSHVVPSKAIDVLLSLADGDVEVWLKPNEAVFRMPAGQVNCRLVEGRYPTWREVLPKKVDGTIPLQVGCFAQAIKQASMATDDDSKAVQMTFKNGVAKLKASSSTRGRSAVEFPIVDGVDHSLHLDPKLVLDMLSRLSPEDEVVMHFVKNNTVCMFTNGDMRTVVVPLTKGDQ